MKGPLRNLRVREADSHDVAIGLGDVLRRLSPDSPDSCIAANVWRGNDCKTWVAEVCPDVEVDGESAWTVVGTVSVFREKKMTHHGGWVGHLEDLVVHPDWEGYGIARALIEHVKEWANAQGCYKVVLSCSERNKALYEKCGFHQNEISMRCDL